MPSRRHRWLDSTAAGRPATMGRRRNILPRIPNHSTTITLHSHPSTPLPHGIVVLSTPRSLLDPHAYRNMSGAMRTKNKRTNRSLRRCGSTTFLYSSVGTMWQSENRVVGVRHTDLRLSSSLNVPFRDFDITLEFLLPERSSIWLKVRLYLLIFNEIDAANRTAATWCHLQLINRCRDKGNSMEPSSSIRCLHSFLQNVAPLNLRARCSCALHYKVFMKSAQRNAVPTCCGCRGRSGGTFSCGTASIVLVSS
jgi:hypothetical protein